jgi:hypothetical protein
MKVLAVLPWSHPYQMLWIITKEVNNIKKSSTPIAILGSYDPIEHI